MRISSPNVRHDLDAAGDTLEANCLAVRLEQR
jgi:hypothetical protein